MKLSTILYLLAAIDLCLALLGYNITSFLGPFSRYTFALLAAAGYLFSIKEKSDDFSFSIDEGESLVWSHTAMGLAFGLTNDKLLFSYIDESYIETVKKSAGKNIKFPETLETKIQRKDIVRASAVKSKLREVLCIELEDDIKIHIPIMGKKKDELLNLLA